MMPKTNNEPDSTKLNQYLRRVPKDVDAIVDYLISITGANQAEGRRIALVVKHQHTSHRRRRA
jgi:hypothetical protein